MPPSPDLDDARFTTINWDAESSRWLRPRRRTVGFAAVLGVLLVLFAYDFLVSPDKLIAELKWDPRRMDWLLVASFVLLGRYVFLPLAINRQRSVKYGRELLSRPAGVLSLTGLVFLAIVAIAGPDLLYDGYPQLADKFQPPPFTSLDTTDLRFGYQCAGQMTGEVCHGTTKYLFGTTRIGEDVALLVAEGIRVALILGLAAGMIMAVVATVVGTLAGYFGGLVDDILMLYVEVQQTVPAIVVFVVFATLFLGEYSTVTQAGLFALALVFGLLDWGGIARLVRSEVLTRRSAGYVRAAKAAGASDSHVIRRHVIPNSTATIVTAVTRRIPLLILAHTALAYLEVHRAGARSLGRLLRIGLAGTHLPWHQKWWVTTFAVIALILITVSFNVFGDVVRDVIEPQSEVNE